VAVEILELHHVGLVCKTAEADPMRDYYSQVLDLKQDHGRGPIPGLRGYFMDVGDQDVQVHLFGKDGPSPFAQGPGKDPAENHLAFAVADILEAEAELKRMGADYFALEGVGAPNLKQLFMRDPVGNIVELHQIGLCRCKQSARAPA
jgi:catechol 2,3-dioxygenase-like lactoylglutathione lyase family enzyme